MRPLLWFAISSSLLCAETPAWVQASNKHAQVLLEITARFNPEQAASLGMEGVDQGVMDLKPDLYERRYKAAAEGVAALERTLTTERDARVRQDLEIMIRASRDRLRGMELTRKYYFPYYDMSQSIFGSVRALLDDQVASSRRPAAVVRLKRYAGLAEGYRPITELARERTRERLSVAGLLGPPKDEVVKDLENARFFVDGMAGLFRKYKLEGWEDAHAALAKQLDEYKEFVRKEVLPRARTDFRVPPELYEFALRQYGVELRPAELAAQARAAFAEIQKQMQALAPKVAKAKGFDETDYRKVIAELKKQQLYGDAILTTYRRQIAEIEDVLRREELVTVPSRPARMRLATPAESAAQPAPHMRPPRLIGNTGESGEFVLPLATPSATGTDKKMDDFTYEAAAYTLTAHEARPGHEMQFSAMLETGVSIARAVFAFNSTNVEGWGLYAERIMLPYMPPEAQLVSLNMRLLRAARAFLDPELHMGKITPEQAYRFLREEVVQSDAMATQEVERYTFRAPGQATSYFHGFTLLSALRDEVESNLGSGFRPKAFHDFVLSQGLLPAPLLRRAVFEEFIPAQRRPR